MLLPEERTLLLTNIARFVQLSATEADMVAGSFKPRDFKRKEHLLNVGEVPVHENSVVKGCSTPNCLTRRARARILRH